MEMLEYVRIQHEKCLALSLCFLLAQDFSKRSVRLGIYSPLTFD